MLKPEATIETTICREAKDAGWICRKLQFIGVRGAPDRIFGKDSFTVMIEFKRLGERPTRQQTVRHDELRKMFGWEVYACDSLDSAREVLRLGP